MKDMPDDMRRARDKNWDKLVDYQGRRWYSAEMMDAVVRERDTLKAEARALAEAVKPYCQFRDERLADAIAKIEEVLHE